MSERLLTVIVIDLALTGRYILMVRDTMICEVELLGSILIEETSSECDGQTQLFRLCYSEVSRVTTVIKCKSILGVLCQTALPH